MERGIVQKEEEEEYLAILHQHPSELLKSCFVVLSSRPYMQIILVNTNTHTHIDTTDRQTDILINNLV